MRKFNDEEAFARYMAMGDKRSMYQVAKDLGVTSRAINKAARRGEWSQRMAEIERTAREETDKRMAETLVQVRERHLNMLRAVEMAGVKALKENGLSDGMQGVKAIEMAIKLERTILGQPSEHSGISIEQITRRELETLVRIEDEPEDPDEEDAA